MITPHGSPSAKLWIILEHPFSTDTNVVADGGLGYVFKKIYAEAGLNDLANISSDECYVDCFSFSDIDKALPDNEIVYNFIKRTGINNHTPPFILVLDERSLFLLCPETRKRNQRKTDRLEGSLDKWAGSLLISPFLNFPHYVIGTYGPQFIMGSWWYRDIAINIDLGHLRDDFQYWKQHGMHKQLPQYKFTIAPPFLELRSILQNWYDDKSLIYLSDDIETIRTCNLKDSIFRENNGIPYMFGFAPSATEALSFCLWDYTPFELTQILRLCDKLHFNKHVIGQNYYNFDSMYKRAMGFRFQGMFDNIEYIIRTNNPPWVEDTLIKHQLLWVELPHNLGFLTRQYTRQPYYKDESNSFNPKNRTKYAEYHCKDCCVTYAVNEALNVELKERGLE